MTLPPAILKSIEERFGARFDSIGLCPSRLNDRPYRLYPVVRFIYIDTHPYLMDGLAGKIKKHIKTYLNVTIDVHVRCQGFYSNSTIHHDEIYQDLITAQLRYVRGLLRNS